MPKYLLALVLVMLLALPPNRRALVQEQTQWSHTANLSQSGAASDPRLILTPDGLPQAFWWDKFDGLMTSAADQDGTWSEPAIANIRSRLLTATPEFVIDPSGMINALWIEEQSSSTGNRRALMHSQVFYTDTTWTIPRKLADYVVTFEAQLTESGEVRLAYIRTQSTLQTPAGVYLIKKTSSRGNWSQPVRVYDSKYMRLLTPQDAQIDLVSTGTISTTLVEYMNWFDPPSKGALLAFSLDQGVVWSQAQATPAGDEDEALTMPILIPGQQAYQVWQSGLQGQCALYQQALEVVQAADADPTLRPGALQPIMDGISDCPQGEQHFETIDGQLFWIWGEATARLSVAARAADEATWTSPRQISVYFEDEPTERKIGLNNLRAAMIGERLLVVGTHPSDGEVWYAETRLTAQDFAPADASTWSAVQHMPLGGEAAGAPCLAIDGLGRTHAVWSAADSAAAPGASLFYAQSSADGALGPFGIMEVVKSTIARQPALLYETGRQVLHLVWSGGMDGSLLYSWVSENEAASPSAWSAPLTISSLADSSWPQLAQDGAGTLYVLFTIPLNEQRGVYLTRSADGGATWSEPSPLFDGAENQAPMVTHPALAIGAAGELHAAWVSAQTPGVGGALSIQYALSLDGGDTWSDPLILAGQGFSWPRLAVAAGQLHLVYAAGTGGRGSIYHRFLLEGQSPLQTSAWSSAAVISGWRDVLLPYGLDASGAASSAAYLYLLAADPQAGLLNYAAWQGESWTPVEAHSEASLVGDSLGASAAAAPQAGQLAAGWLAYPAEEGDEGSHEPGLFLLSRGIPALPAAPLPLSSLPTAAAISPTPSPSPAPTPIPSPTPDLNQPVQSSSLALPLPPMALGGILVGLLVVAIFVGRYLLKQWSSSHR